MKFWMGNFDHRQKPGYHADKREMPTRKVGMFVRARDYSGYWYGCIIATDEDPARCAVSTGHASRPDVPGAKITMLRDYPCRNPTKL